MGTGPLTRGQRYGLAVLVLVATLMLAIAGSYALSLRAIASSQHQWCTTIELLTSNGPPRREGTSPVTYRRGLVFYRHMKELERRFGCE